MSLMGGIPESQIKKPPSGGIGESLTSATLYRDTMIAAIARPHSMGLNLSAIPQLPVACQLSISKVVCIT